MDKKEFVEKLNEIEQRKIDLLNEINLYEYKERCLLSDFLSELDKKHESEVQR